MQTKKNPENRLREIRQTRKFTQAQLGAICKCNASHIAQIETRKRAVSLDMILALLDALDCGFRDIWPREIANSYITATQTTADIPTKPIEAEQVRFLSLTS